MKLTVGSLPSAVYWRRRAVLLGGVLVLVLVFYAACSGSDGSAKRQKTAATNTSSTPDTSASILSPTNSASSPAAKSEAAAPPASPAAASATCSDDEIQLTPTAAGASVPRGSGVLLHLKVKNISSRSCSRDLGAEPQELYLTDGSTKIWSSDACSGASQGTSVRTLAPGAEQVFERQWDGKTTSGGCEAQAFPAAGQYQLFARLGSKISAAVTLTIS